ncbi:hypothetical protein JHK85_056192 [Glycine max]|nr:hypothetical protein JHK85_056192 [Glycine max]
MLQSIHRGQIILLQSLQVVEPPGSIPLVEQFREMVAWPGTQPSLHREDEGPTAQVPQHMEDESFEATIPEPFTAGEEAGDTQTTQVAATTPERSLEVTSEPPALAADLPSPRHTADPSTPVLEIPEDQTTPVLTLDTSPPATLVLHLTDEEDVQTQDTQDHLLGLLGAQRTSSRLEMGLVQLWAAQRNCPRGGGPDDTRRYLTVIRTLLSSRGGGPDDKQRQNLVILHPCIIQRRRAR